MVVGWRRAFCTSIPKEKGAKVQNTNSSPRTNSKFGFLSNPSTSQRQSEPISSLGLHCRPSAAAAAAGTSLPSSPKLRCRTIHNATPTTTPKKNRTTTFPTFSNPPSPKSPSSGSRLYKSNGRCGICLQSLKRGEDPAIFTAECSRTFHFPCLSTLTNKRCTVCSAAWREAPLIPPLSVNNFDTVSQRRSKHDSKIREGKTKSLRVYNDDEPLIMSRKSLAGFNTIRESEENGDVEEEHEFLGFFVDTTWSSLSSKPTDPISMTVEVNLLPEAVVVEAGRRYETHAVVMKVRAPPYAAARGAVHGPPVDLVTVIDVSLGGAKLQAAKRAMRLVISLLRETDRLSIVVFSSGSKRLFPLRRMTAAGRRSAARLVDALVGCGGRRMSVSDALKKAVKVIEDRREKKPFASILLLSDGQDNNPASQMAHSYHTGSPFVVSSTRFSRFEIPVHSVSIGSSGILDHTPVRDAFMEQISALLSLAAHNVRLQLGLASDSAPVQIGSIYSLTGRPGLFGSGSVRLDHLHANEERELLVEMKVPASSAWSRPILSVRSFLMDPITQNPTAVKERHLQVPRPQAVRSSSPSTERLKSLYISTRALAESRPLIERGDLSAAYRMLSSARARLVRSGSGSVDEFRIGLEAELAELNRLGQRREPVGIEGKTGPPTSTSAWRAAERLAKVAMMRKHMNRVSDLHGLENARF